MLGFVKIFHRWLGVLVLPLIVIVGLSGLVLNHSTAIVALLSDVPYDEAQFDDWPNPHFIDQSSAEALATGVFPQEVLQQNEKTSYHGRDVIIFDSVSGQVIIAVATGHYWVKNKHQRLTFDPDGWLIDKKTYWAEMIRNLHGQGWISDVFGTWLADIAATALVIFGLTGAIVIFAGGAGRSAPPQERLIVKRQNTIRPKRIELRR